MKKNESLSSNQLQILNISKAIYQNEFFYKTCLKDNEYYGYLIDNKNLDKIKKNLNFEKLKPLIAKDEGYDKLQKEIKDTQVKIEELVPKSFKTSQELLREILNDNKSYYLIKQDYLSKIIDTNKLTGKEIKFKFHKDLIIFIFSENDSIQFSNNNNGIIEKAFIWKKSSDNSNAGEGDDITTPNNDSNNYNNNKDLEILVRIFYYNKYLTEKENDSFKILNKEDNSETVYLINDSWMNEYKSFFDYQDLENYLKNNKELSDLFAKNNDYLSEKIIKKAIEILQGDFIKKIKEKGNFDINKVFKYEYNQYKNGLNYLCNNHIINSKIYQLLLELKYKLKDSLKKFDLYFVGNKKILLLSNEFGSNRETDEIGFINNDGIFIPEYIFKYKEDNNISLDVLNKFFLKDFINLHLNKNIDICEIKKEEKKFGECYKLNVNNLESPRKEEANNGIHNNNDQNSFNTPGLTDKKEETKEEKIKEKKEETKEINPYIELLINIYLFKEELKTKIKRDLKKTYEEKYYIINKKWMDNLKQLFDYDNKFLNYLNSGNIKDIINKYNPNDKYIEFLSEIIKLFNDDYIKEINSKINEDKMKEIKSLYTYSNTLKEKNKAYYYDNDIEIINKKIKNIIQRIFNIEIGEQKVFLFGDNKIIMSVDYQEQYSLMIGIYNKNDYYEKNYLYNLYTKQNLEYCLKSFTDIGYAETKKILIHPQQNEINLKDDKSSIIGQLYNIKSENNQNLMVSYNQTQEITNNSNNNNNAQQQNQNHNINKIDLNNKFLENQIKALISYYLFTEKLSQNIKSSKIINSECYLIEENWMKNYTNIIFYEELKKQIINIAKSENVENKIEKIYEKLNEEYLKKIKDNENKICKDINNKELSNKLDIFESPNSNDIVKYNNIKFYIIDKKTYEYMNLDPQKKAIIAKNKEYLINCSKIFINISNESLSKFEILFCCLDMTDNIIIPELLFKYDSKILMMNDLDFLKKNDYMKFRNERKLSTNNELIIRNSKNEKVRIIFDLKSPNLLELINKNNTNIKKNQSQNNRAQDAINQKTDKAESKLITNFQPYINSSENKANLRGIPKTNIQKNFDGTKTIQIFEAMNQPQIKLDEMKNGHIEFLLRYEVFEEKLNAKIKNFMFHKEKCFIINYQLIDCFKDFYHSKQLFHFFKADTNLKKIYEKKFKQISIYKQC